jgi:hypothetical protein
MPMFISVSIRLTAIQVSNMNPTGTRASPLFARANWETKVHYRLATSGVSSTFLINETPHSVCDCLTKDYYYRMKKINYNSGEAGAEPRPPHRGESHSPFPPCTGDAGVKPQAAYSQPHGKIFCVICYLAVIY